MQVIEHVACTVCGCVCDDLRITVDNGLINKAEGACKLAEPWFYAQNGCKPPAARIAGKSVPLDEAINRAAELLRRASAPLIYGLSRSSTDGQRAAVALGEQVGGIVDTTASLCHAPSVMAIQEVGESTCTLGEVKNRADLVIYWGSNPLESHPRHLERYSVEPRSRFLPRGRADRTLVVVDVKRTATAELADLFLPIEKGKDFEVLATLRAMIRGHRLNTDSSVGAPLPLLRELAERMKKCRYGVVFFGLGLSMTGLGHQNVAALLLLVTDLNEYTRFCARRMRVPGDVTGADTVLLWQTGYPFSVNFARGYPRYNPGEYSAQDLLEREEVDVCLFVGTEGIARFSEKAIENLRRIPSIVLDNPSVESPISPAVGFTTAVYGVHEPGEVYRMDGVPIPLRKVLPADYPSDCDILTRIADRVD